MQNQSTPVARLTKPIDLIGVNRYLADNGNMTREVNMNEDKFNMEVRKFLKKVGVTSQREIEQAVREALDTGKLSGTETLRAKVTLTLEGVGLTYDIDGEIDLD